MQMQHCAIHKHPVTYCSNPVMASVMALLHYFGTAALALEFTALSANTSMEAMVIHNNQQISQLDYSLLATSLLEINYFKQTKQ